ncbi:methyltransferase, partial [Candidatus Eisenbacteria bacterium]
MAGEIGGQSLGVQEAATSKGLEAQQYEELLKSVQRLLRAALEEKAAKRAIALRALHMRALPRGAGHEILANLTAVNLEGVGSLLKSLFPSGPWLSPALVRPPSVAASPPYVDPVRLRKMCARIAVLLDKKKCADQGGRVFKELRHELGIIKCLADTLVPTGVTQPRFEIMDVPSDEGRPLKVLILADGEPGTRPLVSEELVTALKEAMSGRQLPGARNRTFDIAQAHWDEQHLYAKEQSEVRDPDSKERSNARILVSEVKHLLEDRDVRGVAFAYPLTVYCPTMSFADLTHGERPYLSYSNFWMMEQANRLLSLETLDMDGILQLPHQARMYWAGSTVCSTSAPCLRDVHLSSNDRNNQFVVTALAYLGVPVRSWIEPSTRGRRPSQEGVRMDTLIVPEDEVECRKRVAEAYRWYIRETLAQGHKANSISLAFGSDTSATQIVRVDVARMPASGNLMHRLEFERPARILQVEWERLLSYGISFVALNAKKVREDNAAKLVCEIERQGNADWLLPVAGEPGTDMMTSDIIEEVKVDGIEMLADLNAAKNPRLRDFLCRLRELHHGLGSVHVGKVKRMLQGPRLLVLYSNRDKQRFPHFGELVSAFKTWQEEIWAGTGRPFITSVDWDETEARAGEDAVREIQNALRGVDMVVVLASYDFRHSTFVRKYEMPELRKKYEQAKISEAKLGGWNPFRIVPIRLSDYEETGDFEWFGRLGSLPRAAEHRHRALNGYSEEEICDIYQVVTSEIREEIEQWWYSEARVSSEERRVAMFGETVNKRLLLMQSSQVGEFPKSFKVFDETLELDRGVFSPVDFRSSRVFAEHLRIERGSTFLDMGCGCGIAAICAVKMGAGHVLAVDINSAAVENARRNVKNLGLTERVDVLASDLFSAVEDGSKFDSVYWNPPWVFVDNGVTLETDLEKALVDVGYTQMRRFLSTARDYLVENGMLLIGFGDFGDRVRFERLVHAAGYRIAETRTWRG